MSAKKQILILLDQRDGLWHFINKHLSNLKLPFLRLSSSFDFQNHPHLLKNSLFFIIFWENRQRHPGALIEIIKQHDSSIILGQKIFVLTSNPAHEDVIYFTEIGLEKILKVSLTQTQQTSTQNDFTKYIKECLNPPALTSLQNIMIKIEQFYEPEEINPVLAEEILDLEEIALKDQNKQNQAKILDIKGCIADIHKDSQNAKRYWLNAIELNPSYYKAYNHLIMHFIREKNYNEALALLKKMHNINKNNIRRLNQLAFAYLNNGDEQHSRHFFQSVLDKDPSNETAASGLAKIHFNQDELLACRQLIEKTGYYDKLASLLNLQGIAYLTNQEYKKALAHYLKAALVLTQQEKSHLIFYNIALCFYRCKDIETAQKFATLALTKEPRFEKAQKLLDSINRSQD